MKYIKINILLLIIVSCFVNSPVQSQNEERIYGTLNGNIALIGVYADSAVIAGSGKLIVGMNYELATVNFQVDFNTFETRSAYFNDYFHNSIPIVLKFKGKLGIDYIITQSHPPLDFEVSGMMTLNDVEKRVTFSGRLVHYPVQGKIACNLSMNFKLNLNDYGLQEHFAGFNEMVQIEIMQAVLKNDTE